MSGALPLSTINYVKKFLSAAAFRSVGENGLSVGRLSYPRTQESMPRFARLTNRFSKN
jgi:hypothetical protein